MHRDLYESLLASIEAENWQGLWHDSFFLDAGDGEKLRRQMSYEYADDSAAPNCPPSVLVGIVNRLYTGV